MDDETTAKGYVKGMRLRGIIFDIDGTLVDSLKAYEQAFNAGVASFGLGPASGEDLAERLSEGMNLEQTIVSLYPDRDDPEFLKACREEILAAFTSLKDNVSPLLPRTRETLEALHAKGLKMGVATGRTQPHADVERWLGELGIGRFFEAIVTTAEVRERKPAPDVINECARRLGLSAGECLVVGDSVADVGAGRAAGATVAAVLTGVASAHRLAAREPDVIVNDISELVGVIERDLPPGGETTM